MTRVTFIIDSTLEYLSLVILSLLANNKEKLEKSGLTIKSRRTSAERIYTAIGVVQK